MNTAPIETVLGKTQLSIALVTRNRPESLERALRSLWAQEVQPHEVVVSDDSDDEHARQVEQIVSTYGYYYSRGPRRGLYANRNHAALTCTGTHIHTMDDDHELPPHHVQVCLNAVRCDTEAVYVIGEHYPGEGDHRLPPLHPGQLHPKGYATTPQNAVQCWAIADGSTIFPQVVFAQGIRYAEFFKFGSAFYEFGSRLHWLGYRIKFVRETYVIHHSQEFQQSGQTVWSTSKEMAQASRYFAMLCHSFIYQPTWVNKSQTLAQIVQELLKTFLRSAPALLHALTAYKQQRRMSNHQSIHLLKYVSIGPNASGVS